MDRVSTGMGRSVSVRCLNHQIAPDSKGIARRCYASGKVSSTLTISTISTPLCKPSHDMIEKSLTG